jgi:hypothetical protein
MRFVLVPRAQHRNEPVRTRSRVGHCLAPGGRVGPESPTRYELPNFVGNEPFVFSVVELGEKIGDDRRSAGSERELQRLERAFARARINCVETAAVEQTPEEGSDRARFLFAGIGELDVGLPGVLSAQAPSGLGVTEQKDSHG